VLVFLSPLDNCDLDGRTKAKHRREKQKPVTIDGSDTFVNM